MIDLDGIEARLEGVTPPPWRATEVHYAPDMTGFRVEWSPKSDAWGPVCVGLADPEDAEFVAHAREDVPALIAQVQRLRRLVDENAEIANLAMRRGLHAATQNRSALQRLPKFIEQWKLERRLQRELIEYQHREIQQLQAHLNDIRKADKEFRAEVDAADERCIDWADEMPLSLVDALNALGHAIQEATP